MLMKPIIRPMQAFGPCLKQLLQARGTSASELARMMGYKSRNSIFRILDEEGGHSARQALYDRLMEEDPLAFAIQEREELAQALEISRVGLVAFLDNRAMRELLMDVSMEEAAQEIRLIPADGKPASAKRMIERAKEVEELVVTITGCCDRQICAMMNEGLSQLDARIRITHYVYTGEEELIRNLSAIQPLLYRSDYMAYAVEPGVFSREKQRLYRNNVIYVRAKTDDGKWHDRNFVLVDKGFLLEFIQRGAGSMAQLSRIFSEDMKVMRPLKAPRYGDEADYLAYTEECLKLEQSRAIYMIKRDVPLSYVQTDILSQCVLEGFAEAGIAQNEELEPLLEQLQRVHNQRQECYFARRKPSYTVFDRSAMERFAQTGRQSDHFFAFRPYTPQERVRILTHLRGQAMQNPNFHVYFFKPEYESPPMEITLFEGMGTLMAKPGTDYDLAGDHAETLITQESFCQCYKNYFLQDLLEKQVMNGEETIAELDRLIEIAKNA